MTDLPPGWEWTTLGEIAATSLGKMLDKAKSSGQHPVPYLRNLNVQWGRFDLDDILTMDIPPEQQPGFEVHAGDLLVCEGGEIGRCAIWPGSSSYMAFQKALHRVKPLGGIDARYLRYLLEHLSISKALHKFATGSTIKHLPQQQVRQLPVPLPPLAEQGRIIATLEDHLSRVEVATDTLSDALKRASKIEEAAYRSLLANTEVETFTLSQVLREKPINGRSVPTRVDGFPVLRLTALKNGSIDLGERKNGDWSSTEARPFLVERDDFLVSRGNGTLALVGRGGLVEQEPDPVAFPDTLIRLRPDKSLLLSTYLAIAWNSSAVRAQIESSARTTAGIYKINQSILCSVRLDLPSVQNQQCIVKAMTEIKSTTRRIVESLSGAQKRASMLRSALLAEAFAGQLVPQDPNDESASMLLERISAERATQPKPKRTQKIKPAQETLL